MSITYYGIEWDYNNLADITYNSATLNEPYVTWLYQITAVTEKETETSFSLTYSSKESSVNKDASERLLKFSDYRNSIASKIYNESLSISDSYNQVAISKEKETLQLTDDLPARRINTLIKESKIYLLDEGRFIATDDQGEQTIGEQTEVGGGIVLFDFEINSTPLSESNFENWIEENSPINYNELRPFIPGEYEYKDAYVGFKLSIPPTEGRFGVYGSTVYIDVEDTVEKGFAEATSNGLTRVTFSKRFYTSPHIMSSLVYATENCYVEIPTVTKEYFEFGLKSISTGLYLNGEISWLADGY